MQLVDLIMHKNFMTAALEQAYDRRGFCAPNPAVGAVIVQHNTIIAQASHQGVGTAHAEHAALQLLPLGLDDLTLYVTLEPCNHWGRTPPCVLAIINAGIRRVVYGFRDPNPIVMANDTTQILQAEGIEVIYYPLPEIDAFYQSYYFWTQTKRPWVTAKIAHTLDGKIAGLNGERKQLSNDMCAQFTHQQRLRADIILTTARTIINDNPALNVRIEAMSIAKPVAILDTRLSLPDDATIFTTASHCHIYYDERLNVKKALPNCSYHPIPVCNGRLDLVAVFNHLGELGYHDVWVEAGGYLFSALHHQKLVHTTYLYIVPENSATEDTMAYHGDNFFSRPHTISWQIKDDNMIACVAWQEDSCLPV